MLVPVILSGGAGTRLWPVSRAGHPKPFLQLADGESLLQKTLLRSANVADMGRIVLITNRDYYLQTRDEAAATLPAAADQLHYLLEPQGRNTLPAIAIGALALRSEFGDDCTLLVLPADHLIQNLALFAVDLATAYETAACGQLVTFGIRPERPETGFGYIELGRRLDTGAHAVARFTEKPALEIAERYIEDGRHLWNSGIFCFRAGTFIEEMRTYQPELLAAAESCWATRSAQATLVDCLDEQQFDLLEAVSIDQGLLEKSARVAVVPASFDWSDIGSWDSVAALTPADAAGNRHEGDVIMFDSRNSYVRAESRLVTVLGGRDLFVVETADAVLVADHAHAQRVREVVSELKSRSHGAALLHRTVIRPWGAYTVLEEGADFKMKRIEVKPGGRLSLQLHNHRSEHWVIVSGHARVTNDERIFEISSNESTYISPGHRHRLENIGEDTLVVIEVQCGAYLGEDDIVRLEDAYGR